MDPLVCFISSGIDEFHAERELLERQLLATRVVRPWVFEYGNATPIDAVSAYRVRLERSEIFVGIYGREIRPAVRDELHLAHDAGIPLLLFIDAAAPPEVRTEIEELSSAPRYRVFRSVAELLGAVPAAVEEELLRRWRRFALTDLERSRLTAEQAAAAPPLPPRPFTQLRGRDDLVATVRDLIEGGDGLVALTGIGGIGKTSVLWQVADDLQTQGKVVLWASVRRRTLGASSEVDDRDPASVVLEALTNVGRITDDRADDATIRQHTAGAVVVVDNLESDAETERMVEYLERAELRSAATLLGSRASPSVGNVTVRRVKGLDDDAVRAIVIDECARLDLVEPEDAVVDTITSWAHGVPLLVRHLVGRVSEGWPLPSPGSGVVPDAVDAAVDGLFGDTWARLRPGEQRLLATLSASPDPPDLELLRSTVEDPDFDRIVAHLTRLNLGTIVRASERRTFAIHPVIKLFMASQGR
jgi:ATP-dependent Clp protease adapter protein ClpS